MLPSAFSAQEQSGALGVEEPVPGADHPPGLEAVLDFFQVDRLLFQGSSQRLNEEVVHKSALSVHQDMHSGVAQRRKPRFTGMNVMSAHQP